MKGEGAKKLHVRMCDHYVSISRTFCQNWLNSNREHSRTKNPPMTNKPPLRPVVSYTVQSQHQIDLVDFTKHAVEKDGKLYKYVLSVLDVFSRFVQLRPMGSKRPAEVKHYLKEIYRYVTNYYFESVFRIMNSGASLSVILPIQ